MNDGVGQVAFLEGGIAELSGWFVLGPVALLPDEYVLCLVGT